MAADSSRLRQQIFRSQQAIQRLLRQLLRDRPMTPGTFYLQKRRCGKPNCRCARGQLHAAWVITRSVAGSTRTYMVPTARRARLRQLTTEYRRYQRARAQLVKRQGQVVALSDRLADLRLVRWPEPTAAVSTANPNAEVPDA
jgi:hypothetical protein